MVGRVRRWDGYSEADGCENELPLRCVVFKTWTASDHDPEQLARTLEAHLSEFAQEVISVGYAVSDRHFVLVVYRPLEADHDHRLEAAVSVAEEIVEQAQA